MGPMSARKISLYLQVPNSLKQIHVGSNNFTEEELNIITDAIPEEISKQYFKKSNFSIIKLGEWGPITGEASFDDLIICK